MKSGPAEFLTDPDILEMTGAAQFFLTAWDCGRGAFRAAIMATPATRVLVNILFAASSLNTLWLTEARRNYFPPCVW